MHTTGQLTTLAVVSTIVGVVVLVRRRRESRIDLPSVVVALAAAAAVGLVGLAVIVVVVWDRWVRGDLIVHHAYLALTVTVPLVALAGLALGLGRGSSVAARVVGLVLLLPAVLGAYATHVEPYRLRVDHHDVAVDPARRGDDAVRIAVLADIQTSDVGEHEHEAVDEVLAARPDVILVPGDIFQGRTHDLDDELPALRELIGRLEAPGGVYFVRGDVDQGRVDRAATILEGLDITVLEDEVADVEVGDRLLRIGGTRLDYASEAADEVRADLLAEPDDGAVTILLSHRPDTVFELPDASRVDLTVAGHTHGGQVVLPLIGPLVHNTAVPRDVARGGLHEVDGNALYIGPGVGLVRGLAPQVRFLSRPAVGILTLREA